MTLYMFYGKECPHCHNMMPLVEKLEKELNVKVEILEVWYDKKNAKLMKEITCKECEFVPMFCNTDTKDMICGPATYGALKKWAINKKAKSK